MFWCLLLSFVIFHGIPRSESERNYLNAALCFKIILELAYWYLRTKVRSPCLSVGPVQKKKRKRRSSWRSCKSKKRRRKRRRNTKTGRSTREWRCTTAPAKPSAPACFSYHLLPPHLPTPSPPLSKQTTLLHRPSSLLHPFTWRPTTKTPISGPLLLLLPPSHSSTPPTQSSPFLQNTTRRASILEWQASSLRPTFTSKTSRMEEVW